jgi:hypothetical protein
VGKQMKKLNDEVSTRFKIIYTLIQAKKSLKCAEIAKEVGIADNLAIWHLKKLVDEYLILEDEKGYICQPFLIDPSIQEDLNSLMKVIVKIILRELTIPDGYTKKDIEKSLIKNLEIYIQSFAVDHI